MCTCTGSVLDHVGESLLDDPVPADIEDGVDRPHRTIDTNVHLESRVAHLLHEYLELAERRLRTAQGGLVAVAAKHPQEGAELTEGATGGPLDGFEDLHRPPRIRLCRAAPSTCLYGDHAHRMGDDVVELTGDPASLFLCSAPRVLVPLVLEPSGAFLELGEVRRDGCECDRPAHMR